MNLHMFSATFLLVLLVAAGICSAQQVTGADIVVGRTVPRAGIYADEGTQVDNGVKFFVNWLQRNRGGMLTTRDGVQHKLRMYTLDDGSNPETAGYLYEMMSRPEGETFLRIPTPVHAVIGPWTTVITQPVINITRQYNIPFIFSGASVPTFYNSTAYPHAVGLLVQTSKRSGSCMRMYGQQLGIRTAAVIASTDSFQVTARNTIFSQLAAQNITILYNTTVDRAATQFGDTIPRLSAIKPELLVLALGPQVCLPFARQMFARLNSWQPKATFVTNSATIGVLNKELDWRVHYWNSGDQWVAAQEYVDSYFGFGSTAGFVAEYRSEFNVTPTFLDAASAATGFVLLDAVSRVDSNFTSDELIAALRSTTLNETFMGPIRFLPSGELDQSGLCAQFLPAKSNGSTPGQFELRSVAPDTLALETPVYPVRARPPPGFLKWHEYSHIASIIFMVFACIIMLASIATAFFIAFKFGKQIFAQQGYWFIVAILLGIILTAFTVFPLAGEPTKASCVSQIWLSVSGAACIICVLFAKAIGSAYRYHMRNTGQTHDEEVHQRVLASIAGGLLFVIFILLIVWTATASPVPSMIEDKQNEGTFYLDCSHSSPARMGWLFTVICFLGLLLLTSVVIVFVTRSLNEDYREARRIMWLVYLVAFITIAFTATIWGSNGFYQVQFIAKCTFAVFFALTVYLLQFGPLVSDYIGSTFGSSSGNGSTNSKSVTARGSVTTSYDRADGFNNSGHE